MPVGIEKIVVIHEGQEQSWKRFYVKGDVQIQLKAIYYDETPENLRGTSKWIVEPKKNGPFTKDDQGGKIGDTRGITVPAKFCGPKEYVIEAFMSRPENKYPTQLVFFGVAPKKIVSTEWSESRGGSNIKNSKRMKYGDVVWLHMETEGLNGAILEVDVYHRKGTGRDDTKVTTIRNVECINGEVNLKIDNTYSWRAFTGLWTDNEEDFYIKVRLSGKKEVLLDKQGDDKHAIYLKFKDEITKREVGNHENAKPLTVGENEIDVERYEACRFTKLAVTEKGQKPITVFEEGKILLDNQGKKEFQASQTIYFDYDKWEVKSEAKKVLNSLIQLLLDNPYVPAQLGAHCDSRGTHEYNNDLSDKRAKAVVDYLVTKGISRKNLKWKGYGKRKPVIAGDNLTEAQHKENRRVTVKFLVSGGDAESIVYEAIAGDKTKTLDVTIDVTDYKTEKCLRRNNANTKHEANKVKVVELTSLGKNEPSPVNGEKPIKYRVYSSLSKDRFVPYEYILPHKSKTNDFRFYINSCRYYSNKEKPALIIKTYPDIKWDFHFYAKLSNPLAVRWQGLSKANDSKMRSVNSKIAAQNRWKQSEAAFGAVLKANWNKIDDLNYEKDFEVTAKYEDKFKQLYEVFSYLREISKGITSTTKGKATKVLGSKQPFEVEVVPPNIAFGAEWMLARGSKKQKALKEIGTEIKVYLKAEPIIGLKLIIDLLDIVLKGASMAATGNTVAADLFIMVKDWAAEGYKSENVEISFDMWIDLILQGNIEGGVDFTLNTASDKKSVAGDIGVKLSAELSAGVNLKAKVVILKAGSAWAQAEASASAKMGITGGVEFKYRTYNGLFFKPKLVLDACVGKVLIMVEVGLSYKVVSADWKPINYSRKRTFWDKFDIIDKLEDITGIDSKIQIIKP